MIELNSEFANKSTCENMSPQGIYNSHSTKSTSYNAYRYLKILYTSVVRLSVLCK